MSTLAPEAPTRESVDLSDLDLLDDPDDHVLCLQCNPPPDGNPWRLNGSVRTALCGKRILVSPNNGRPLCSDCKDVPTCPKCGDKMTDLVRW